MRSHHFTIPDSFSPQGNHRVHYTEWGDPHNPRVLWCVHGLTRNARDFDYLAHALAEDYRIICPDVPGRGKSAWLAQKEQYHYGTYVTDMLLLMQHLQMNEIDWVGTSMGGLIGMMIAAQPNSPIRQMVMNDIGPFIPAAPLRRISKYVGIMPDFLTLTNAEKHLQTILAPFGITDPNHWRHVTEHSVTWHEDGHYRLAYDPAIANAFGASEAEIADVDLWPLWHAVQCPVLVLRGEQSDTLPKYAAQQMQPKATLVEFPGIGHAPALMDSAQINVVREWLLTKK